MEYETYRNTLAGHNIFYNPDQRNQSYLPQPAPNSSNPPSVWVFGYGSLCWYPGFDYVKCVTGYIRGYVRRFWQGNVTHRGVPSKPGRVVTLVEDKQGITWGCAYKITGRSALEYLEQRECNLGGYVTVDAKFFPRVGLETSEICGEAFPVLVYIATPKNSHWLGESSANSIARQIAESSGPSGHNVEYLKRLAKFMREEIPEAIDNHLFELEQRVRRILFDKRIPLNSVMGNAPQRIRRNSYEERRRPATFEFTSRVPETRLRCLNL